METNSPRPGRLKSSLRLILSRLVVAVLLAVTVSTGAAGRASSAAPVTTSTQITDFQQVAPGMGWILFGGQLYWTKNDGAAWTDITPKAQAQIEAVTFLDATRGRALLSGSSGYALAVTDDDGASWRVRSLAFPELARADAPVAKVFIGWRNESHGWLVFKLATGSNFSRGILFVTFDGGVNWEARAIPLGEPATFVSETEGWVAGGPAGDQYFETRDGGRTWQAVSGGGANRNGDQFRVQKEAGMGEVSASSSESGWAKWESGECANGVCAREARLLATRDGGVHWSAMSLPNGQTSLRESFSIDKSLSFADADTQAYIGQGFDKCEIAALAQMQTWWNSSPYSAVNLYIGGASRACSNSALGASFLSQLNAQGWRFIPTWVGLQAACNTFYSHRMSYDVTTAYNQGVAEADSAIATAQSLGLTEADGSGTIVYFDLEAYDTSNSNCRAAANSFISGWTYQMQLKGNLAGVYGASCASAPSDWWSIANVPDALWIANWYGNPGTVSYTRTASVWNAACLSNSLWPNHQRLRQYAGDHNETWGGLTLNIDSNVLDGPLTVPNGSANSSAPSAPISPGPADGATLERANDAWLSWKTNGDTCSVHVWSASYDSTVANNCSLYHLGVLYGGAYAWQVTASNGFGSTAGPTWHFNVKPAAPTGLAAAAVSSTRVNLSWTPSSDEPAVDGYAIYADGLQVGSAASGANSFQVQNLMCNTAHSFYVKAVRQGVQSNASNTASATTASCAPTLLSPANGAALTTRRPAFDWTDVAGASGYALQLSKYSNFSSIYKTVSSVGSSAALTADLPANTRFYWRVRANSASGPSPWSQARNFLTANPPSVPTLYYPFLKSSITDLTPRFRWKQVAVPAGTTFARYQIQVATDSAFTSIVINKSVVKLTTPEFTPTVPLLRDTKYFWRVMACNTKGHCSAWSVVWWFKTATTAVFTEIFDL